MSPGTLTEPLAVAKAKPTTMDARVEFVAAAAWVARVERQAERRGLSVGAYIRQATNVQLEADEASEPKPRRKES